MRPDRYFQPTLGSKQHLMELKLYLDSGTFSDDSTIITICVFVALFCTAMIAITKESTIVHLECN